MRKLLLAVLAAAIGSVACADNLLVNPGFETGDLTGWNVIPSDANSNLWVAEFGLAHSGNWSLNFGASGDPVTDDYIYQDVITTPGEHYTFSAWVVGNEFVEGQVQDISFSWGGHLLFDGPTPVGVTFYNYDVIASSNITRVKIGGYNNANFNSVDDLSVATVAPEPASMAVLALGAISLMRRRRR